MNIAEYYIEKLIYNKNVVSQAVAIFLLLQMSIICIA